MWLRIVLPVGLVAMLAGGAVFLLTRGEDDPEVEFVVPEAVEALQAAPEAFDQVAWCADVTASFEAQDALDRTLSTGSPEAVAAASQARIAAIESPQPARRPSWPRTGRWRSSASPPTRRP